MIKYRKQLDALYAGLLSLLISSCSGDNSDLVKYMNDVTSRPANSIEPIPRFAPLPFFKFPEHDSRRSPFKPVVLRKKNNSDAPDQKRLKQPLEAYPLDALKLVGILEQDSVIWALIKQPDEQIIRVRVGNYMGQNYGRIVVIKRNLIQLDETLQDTGTWEKKMTTINLDVGKQE